MYPNWQGSNSRGESNETLFSTLRVKETLWAALHAAIRGWNYKNNFMSLKFPIHYENYVIGKHVQSATKMKPHFNTKSLPLLGWFHLLKNIEIIWVDSIVTSYGKNSKLLN